MHAAPQCCHRAVKLRLGQEPFSASRLEVSRCLYELRGATRRAAAAIRHGDTGVRRTQNVQARGERRRLLSDASAGRSKFNKFRENASIRAPFKPEEQRAALANSIYRGIHTRMAVAVQRGIAVQILTFGLRLERRDAGAAYPSRTSSSILAHPPQHWLAAWPASCVRATPSVKFGVTNVGPARSAGEKFCPVRWPRPNGPDKEFSRQVRNPVFLTASPHCKKDSKHFISLRLPCVAGKPPR